MTFDNVWGKVWEGFETVDWTWNIWQNKEETAEKVVSLLSRDSTNFGLFYLTDLEKVWKGHTNLFSKDLLNYRWVDITFQSTRCDEWWVIAEHSHGGPEENDITDELIIMMNKGWVYWDIGAFLDHNWIMKIQAWAIHWWKSNWNWVSLKPKGYKFDKIDIDWWLIYSNWKEKIKIMRLSWNQVFLTKKLWYKELSEQELSDKEYILFLEFWEWLVNVRKSTNGRMMPSWDSVVIWKV